MGATFQTFCTMAALVAIYANLAVIAHRYGGAPLYVTWALLGLLGVSFVYEIYIRRQPLILDRTFIWIMLFLTAMVAAAVPARDPGLAVEKIAAFVVEGVILYVLLINVLRDWGTLRRAIWVVLLTAAVLGGLSLYQEITKSYSNEFGGLAQRRMVKLETNAWTFRYSNRSQGPIGETNRFAQVMAMLLPLAVVAFSERRGLARIAAFLAGALIFLGVLTTYSRGAIIAMAVMLPAMILCGLIRVRTALAAGSIAFATLAVVTPSYVDRIATIGGVPGLFVEDAGTQPDSVTRKRMTEMAAAFYVFTDHPVLGVGPGQYLPYYSMKYQLDPDTAFKHIPEARRAHNLYTELAAETGLAGLTVFIAIAVSLLCQLYSLSRALGYERPQIAAAGVALGIGIVGYLVAGVFLHLAFQRYYWMLLALGGAMVHVMQKEKRCAALEDISG